jgi:hypothetical protein
MLTEHWRAVSALASELIEHGRIEGDSSNRSLIAAMIGSAHNHEVGQRMGRHAMSAFASCGHVVVV